jgi:hypothetical protein
VQSLSSEAAVKILRLAVPLVLAAFTLTCQGDQPTAADDTGFRAAPESAVFKKGKHPPPPPPPPDKEEEVDYYVEQVRARLSESGELLMLSVRVRYKNASTVSCESALVELAVTTWPIEDYPEVVRTFFCGADVCDEPGGGGATFRCSGTTDGLAGVYEIRAELIDGVNSEDPNRDNFGYSHLEIP